MTMTESGKVQIATRGSALALVQARAMQAACRELRAGWEFELQILKTTGDKLQTASMSTDGRTLGKGLFTKELEVALLNGRARLAVHSLKDLPTELPKGLVLGAVPEREDVRDVLIWRLSDGVTMGSGGLPVRSGGRVATSSTRRAVQLKEQQPDVEIVAIRGNVGTRLSKLRAGEGLDAMVLAAAGLKRLGFFFGETGELRRSAGECPEGLGAMLLPVAWMLPCVGQAALGIEMRGDDAEMRQLGRELTHAATEQCVLAERAFLRRMGGGCLSPVAALAAFEGEQLRMHGMSAMGGRVRRAEVCGAGGEGERLAVELADRLEA